jgi:hypothetical protein
MADQEVHQAQAEAEESRAQRAALRRRHDERIYLTVLPKGHKQTGISLASRASLGVAVLQLRNVTCSCTCRTRCFQH